MSSEELLSRYRCGGVLTAEQAASLLTSGLRLSDEEVYQLRFQAQAIGVFRALTADEATQRRLRRGEAVQLER